MPANKWDQAKCRGIELPWTDDQEPNQFEQKQMRELCGRCPARQACARHALGLNGESGGFYAGTWLPWPSVSKNYMGRRRAARGALRQAAGHGFGRSTHNLVPST